MNKKYIIRLTAEERKQLATLVQTGKTAAYKRRHAQVLLKADVGEQGPGWTDQKIAEAFNIGVRTIERIRQRLVEQGLDAAIQRAKGGGRKPTFTGEHEAHLIALNCSEPPPGRVRWTLRLLADRMVELNYTEYISHDTVGRLLKKRT